MVRRGRYVYCKVQNMVVPKGQELHKTSNRRPNTGIITDTMDAAWHPCTGEYIDSKAKFREITRAHGCIEYGDELPVVKPVDDLEPVEDTLNEMWERSIAGTLPHYDEPSYDVPELDEDFSNIPVIDD